MSAEEEYYWSALEYRICHEMVGGYWCDGLAPSQFFLESPEPSIIGIAHICKGQTSYEVMAFTLFLPRKYSSRAEIDWSSLLPARNVKGWVELNPRAKRLVIRLPQGSGR